MSRSPIITWFEIPTDNYERAVEFYQSVFEVSLQQEQMCGMQMAVFPHGEQQTAGAIVKGDQLSPQNDGVVIYLYTENMDAAVARITSAGGQVVMPSTAISAGQIALFIDSEGNRIGLHSNG